MDWFTSFSIIAWLYSAPSIELEGKSDWLGMGHVTGVGKLSKNFLRREDGKDIPQEEGTACLKHGSQKMT